METWEAISSRRNVRSFTDEPLPAVVLERILEAGWRAPSSRNWQPWDFVVVTDREQLQQLSEVWQGGGISPAPRRPSGWSLTSSSQGRVTAR